jgi:divalent metal cation (Fe/Co/Zn/Cd) transporter
LISSWHRDAFRVSVVSVLWTLLSSAAGVAIGVVTPSLVLVAFGLTGAIDAAGSWALALHFRHALEHETVSARREEVAHRIICTGLIIVGGATVLESVRRLVTSTAGHGSAVGAVIAGASVVALTALATVKRRIARRLDSNPLRADSNLSATGALLGVITVVGAVADSATWVDAACALVIGAAAAASGVVSMRAGV